MAFTKPPRAPISAPTPRKAHAPEICLIAAIGPNYELGSENRLPWKLPRDLRIFRFITSKFPTVIMGRKTFESLGRPLPKRRNIVISTNKNLTIPGVEVVHSLEEAIDICRNVDRVFVIGGGQTYRDAMPYATEVFLTKIILENPTPSLFPAFFHDVTFPKLDADQWELNRRSRKHVASSNLIPKKKNPSNMYFFFEIYRKK